jgi:hypothetical protein
MVVGRSSSCSTDLPDRTRGPQEPLIQVGTPNRGKIQRMAMKYTATITMNCQALSMSRSPGG